MKCRAVKARQLIPASIQQIGVVWFAATACGRNRSNPRHPANCGGPEKARLPIGELFQLAPAALTRRFLRANTIRAASSICRCVAQCSSHPINSSGSERVLRKATTIRSASAVSSRAASARDGFFGRPAARPDVPPYGFVRANRRAFQQAAARAAKSKSS